MAKRLIIIEQNYTEAVRFRSFLVPVDRKEQGLRSIGKTCRWCSWAGFANFKKQNRELPYARSVGQAGNVIRNFVNGKVPIRSRKLSVMKKFVKVLFFVAMKPNGPAIKNSKRC